MLDRPDHIPDAPGSYQFKDEQGRIIYVGKAASLRSRVSSYFQDRYQLHPRTVQMLERAASVEWIQVRSDVEAIMLEYNLIKQHRPRFNIRLVDDKSYPYLAVTVDEQWPRAMVMRGARRKGTRYFGPYAHAYAIRETLDLLLRSFPIRTCTDAKFRRHERLGRPCLLFHIERCSGPCVGDVSQEEYRGYVEELMAFLAGDTKPIVDKLTAQMKNASSALEFELAARLRDRLETVHLAIERQEMVADTKDDLDVVGITGDDLEGAVQVLHVRRGHVVGRDGFILEKVEPLTDPEFIGKVLEQLYAESPLDVPKEVLLPELPDDVATFAAWLSQKRGGKVELKVPRRGRRAALARVAVANASEQLQRHRLRRSSDLTSRAKALEELQSYLGLSESPLRIECYDMSHLQGSDYVGSMVVLEDGLAKRSDYRRFKVSVPGNDDYGAMREVLTRRLKRLDEAPKPALEGRPVRFAYPPQLLLLDGGRGQLNVGVQVLEELGLSDRMAIASLAKAFEEVFIPGRAEPIRIPRDSEAIYLLQQIRDEAHRFAIGFHRELRGKRMTKSALDDIPGLGPARRQRLLSEFGSQRAIKAATFEELVALDFLPERVAEALHARLHPELARDARALRVSGVDPSATSAVSGAAVWDEHADWWQDTFTYGADVEYEGEILPLVARELAKKRRVLDVGCGEGQVARHLAPHVGAVLGLDPSSNQLAHARLRASDLRLVQGAGERLPFADASFDAAFCCLSIEHADDADAVLGEVARVLEDGGTFLLLINHPLYQGPDSGLVDDQILGERYWRVGRYLTETTVLEHVDAHVRIPFAHRPLSRYINPLAAHDLVMTQMFEPPPLAAFLAGSVDPDLEGAIPRLLVLRFEHRPARKKRRAR